MKKLSAFFLLILLLGIGRAVFAAGVTATIIQGPGYTLRLLLTTDLPVNAYDFEFSYPSDLVAISAIDTSHSIVTVLPRPVEAVNGSLVIRGGSNQSFSGAEGELVTLYVKPLRTGTLQFKAIRARIFSADGKGTPEEATFSMKPITVTAASLERYAQEAPAATPTDSTAPNLYPLAVVENPIDPQTKLLVMTAQDSQSGVGALLVRTRSWLFWTPWQKAVNPYPLEGNEWEMQVAAFDNVGNRTSQTYYRINLLWPKVIGLTLCLLFIVGVFWYIHRRKRRGTRSV